MASLIVNGIVAAVGEIEDFGSGVAVKGAAYYRSVFPNLLIVDTNPPSDGDWAYVDGKFVARLSDIAIQRDPLEVKREIIDATQKRLDDFAKTRLYDGILSATTYAVSSIPKFAAEGQYAVQIRDLTWAALYQLLAEVEGGTRPMPTGFDEVEPLLPVPVWPN